MGKTFLGLLCPLAWHKNLFQLFANFLHQSVHKGATLKALLLNSLCSYDKTYETSFLSSSRMASHMFHLQDSTLPLLLRVQAVIPKTFEIEGMKPNNLVKDLKAEICKQEGIPAYNQILKISGQQLGDGKSLAEYNIQNGSKLFLNTAKIYVRYSRQRIEVPFSALKTCGEIKEELYQRDGCPIEQQRIAYGGKELHDQKTMADYNIQADSILDLRLMIPK